MGCANLCSASSVLSCLILVLGMGCANLLPISSTDTVVFFFWGTVFRIVCAVVPSWCCGLMDCGSFCSIFCDLGIGMPLLFDTEVGGTGVVLNLESRRAAAATAGVQGVGTTAACGLSTGSNLFGEVNT